MASAPFSAKVGQWEAKWEAIQHFHLPGTFFQSTPYLPLHLFFGSCCFLVWTKYLSLLNCLGTNKCRADSRAEPRSLLLVRVPGPSLTTTAAKILLSSYRHGLELAQLSCLADIRTALVMCSRSWERMRHNQLLLCMTHAQSGQWWELQELEHAQGSWNL